MEALFKALVLQIEVGEEHLSIVFRSLELRRFLTWDGKTAFRGMPADWPCSDARFELRVAVCAISAERWPVVHIHGRDPAAKSRPSKRLVRLLQEARRAQRVMDEHRELSGPQLAAKMDYRPGHFSRLIRLNFLAPDIVTAILDGDQPATMTPDLLRKANLPLDWAVQRKLFGFPEPARPLPPRQLYGRGMWPARPGPEPKPHTRE